MLCVDSLGRLQSSPQKGVHMADTPQGTRVGADE